MYYCLILFIDKHTKLRKVKKVTLGHPANDFKMIIKIVEELGLKPQLTVSTTHTHLHTVAQEF
jgi:hypothetical protein